MTSQGAVVRITVDDEWANEHQAADEMEGGSLVLRGVSLVEGDVAATVGGWISEIHACGDAIVFDFCDRDQLVIKAGDATWESPLKR